MTLFIDTSISTYEFETAQNIHVGSVVAVIVW